MATQKRNQSAVRGARYGAPRKQGYRFSPWSSRARRLGRPLPGSVRLDAIAARLAYYCVVPTSSVH